MVLLGGLEIVAAGYLLNEFNKDKVEAREKRKHRDDRHDSRPSDEYHRPSNMSLAIPHQPLRPTSAPPGDLRPMQRPPPNQYQPQGPSYPFQDHLQQWRPQQQPYPQQGPPPNQPHHMGLPPGLARPPQGQPQLPPPYTAQQFPSAPGLGTLQHAHTFQPPQQNRPPMQGQFMQNAQTFPQAPPAQINRPSNVYIDSKTGRVQHNLYPPDHPMSQPGANLPPEAWGDLKPRNRSNSGLNWTVRDEDDLAYGKDYTERNSRSGRRSGERSRRRSSGSRY